MSSGQMDEKTSTGQDNDFIHGDSIEGSWGQRVDREKKTKRDRERKRGMYRNRKTDIDRAGVIRNIFLCI